MHARIAMGQNANFYPRSPCGERRYGKEKKPINTRISIHALLAESDSHYSQGLTTAVSFLSTLSLRRATSEKGSLIPRPIYISIHALLAESDHVAACRNNTASEFLSTLSLRRATRHPPQGGLTSPYFYPRSPCGERPSYHHNRKTTKPYFYPRSPCGERRPMQSRQTRLHRISIHALLAESDCVQARSGFSAL